MKGCTAFVAMLFATIAGAQTIEVTPRGVVVAHDGRLELYDTRGNSVWSVAGVANANVMASDAHRVVAFDPVRNEGVLVDLRTGTSTRLRTGETPAAAAFAGEDLFVLERDANQVRRLGGGVIPVDSGSILAGTADRGVFVYSRITGALVEIEGDRETRRVMLPTFASEVEIDGTNAYAVYPREARIRSVDLATMTRSGEVVVGAVPADTSPAGGGTAITARILAVADPASKRVWLTESTQSAAKAFGRGFFRGLLGLGLFGGRSVEFPTAVDRVDTRGEVWIAYDTANRTLYRFTKREATAVAHGIAPNAFAVHGDELVYWDADGTLNTVR